MKASMNGNAPYRKLILIPTDFSRVCENAIHHGYEIARRLEYSLSFLHVVSPGPEGKRAGGWASPATRDFRKLYCMKEPVRSSLSIRKGNLFKVINKVAGQLHPNLMVLGTHGKHGLQYLYGSYALRVVLDAPCPVIVVHNRPVLNGYRNILVPVHGLMDACQTTLWLIRFHKIFGSRVMLFRMAEADKGVDKNLRDIQRAIGSELTTAGVPWDADESNLKMDFSSQVLELASGMSADLIMTIPGSGDYRFSFVAWNERLMFNPSEIPVMCLNQLEPDNQWCEWMAEN
jgi:nucleotide-binding universal stress UspA family protein